MSFCDLPSSLPPSPPPPVTDTPPARCDPKKSCHTDSQSGEGRKHTTATTNFRQLCCAFPSGGVTELIPDRAGKGKIVRGEGTSPSSGDIPPSDCPSTLPKWPHCVCTPLKLKPSLVDAAPSPVLLPSGDFSLTALPFLWPFLFLLFLLLPVFPFSISPLACVSNPQTLKFQCLTSNKKLSKYKNTQSCLQTIKLEVSKLGLECLHPEKALQAVGVVAGA